MTARVRDESVTLDALLGRKLTYRDVTPLLAQGYAAALDIDLAPGSLTPWEQETAARLRRDKYTSDEWRFRK
jgi:lipoate-protein ligase A